MEFTFIVITKEMANNRNAIRNILAGLKGYSWGEGRRFNGIRPCTTRYAEAVQKRCLNLLRRKNLDFSGEYRIADLYSPKNEKGISQWAGEIRLMVPEECVAPKKPVQHDRDSWDPAIDGDCGHYSWCPGWLHD